MNSRHTFGGLAALLIAAVAGIAGCADVAAVNSERSDRQEFPFAPGRITIDSTGTDLRLVPGGGNGSLSVERQLSGKATKDGNASWSLADGTLRLNVTCSGFVPDCGARHIVAVPEGTAVEVVSRGGAVRSAGFPGDLTVTVHDNWLRVEDPVGVLRLTAEMGVVVTGARSPEVTARSHARDIELVFAAAPRRVEARAAGGSVDVTLPAGPETYQVTGSGLAGDPGSDRIVVAVSEHGRAQVRKAP